MDTIVDEIIRAAIRCEDAAAVFETEQLKSQIDSLQDAVSDLASAWSGSWLGHQSHIYTCELFPPGPGEYYDSMWGRPNGNWCNYTYEAIRQEILERSQLTDESLIEAAASAAIKAFKQSREDLLPSLDALLSDRTDETLKSLRNDVAELRSSISAADLVKARQPKHFTTRDAHAASQFQQGHPAPPHIAYECYLGSWQSAGIQCGILAQLARRTAKYLEQKKKIGGKTVAKTSGKIFIGHGHSPEWLELKNFIQNRLHLEPDDYNQVATAGLTISERLNQMLDEAIFAFLVMTAEDEQNDGSLRARENVVHEAGLFQGRFGMKRAIILLEQGCNEFSNLHGINQIRFPKGNIRAVFEEVRHVLERENIIGSTN